MKNKKINNTVDAIINLTTEISKDRAESLGEKLSAIAFRGSKEKGKFKVNILFESGKEDSFSMKIPIPLSKKKIKKWKKKNA